MYQVGDYQYYGNKTIQSVALPPTVKTIGSWAFSWTNLKSIDIPESVKAIGEYAFNWCSSLITVTLHEGLKSIGEYAFYRSGLESIELPTSLEGIGENAFGSSKRKSVKIPKSVKTVGGQVFSNCQSLSTLSIEEGMSGTIGGWILYGSSLSELTLPQSLWSNDTLISENAFADSKLTKIIFSCGKGKSECEEITSPYKGKDVEIICGECSTETS